MLGFLKNKFDTPGILFISALLLRLQSLRHGVRAEIEKANVGYMGVFLDAGSHEVNSFMKPRMKWLAGVAHVGGTLTLGLMCIKKKGRYVMKPIKNF